MFYWDTGDRVVDVLLRQMEGFSRYEGDIGGEPTHQLLCALMDIEAMLPQAVGRHFKLPYLAVGGAHFDRGAKHRENLVAEITTALKVGLERASEDPDLKRGGGADFSDRPISQGERVLEAAEVFEKEMTRTKFVELQQASFGTNLHYRIKTIEMLMTRTRPYQNQDPMVAMHGELHRLDYEAEGYFSVRASHQ